MGLSSTQREAAKSGGMVHEVVVPSGKNFDGSDFGVYKPDDARAIEWLEHLARRNIAGAERKPS